LQNTELRPYGAGELLDRAITLFVRQFVPIVIVLSLAIVPLVALQAIVSPESARVFSDLGRVFAAAGNPAAQREAANAMSMRSGNSEMVVAFLFFGVLVRLLMWSAIVALIASAYTGTRTTIAEAYRIGVRRWIPQIVVAFAFAVVAGVVSIPLIILYLVVILAVAATAALKLFAATVGVAIVGGVGFLAALTIVFSWVFMAYELASFTVVTETGNPIEAVGTAVRRGLARGMRWRTVIGGLVIFLVSQVGALPLVAIAAIATAATHADVLYFAIVGAGSVLLEGLVAAFVVVYAVDVRVRREGWDIIAAEPPPAIA
jgi:hypothetical protein